MKVLFISHALRDTYLPHTGGFIYDQAVSLQNYGYEMNMVAVNLISLKSIVKYKKIDFGFKRYNNDNISQMVYQIPSIPFMKGLNRWIRNKLLIRLIKKNISENGLPQLAHVHVFYSGNAAIWLKNNFKIPFVITEHFSVFAQKLNNKSEYNFAQNVYKNANLCIGVSLIFCDFLTKLFNVPFVYVPNTVNVDLFKISPQKEIKSEKIIITVGSFTKNKNQELLIRSLTKISTNVKLIIVGDGELKPYLQNLVHELKLDDKVYFNGLASKNELVKLLQQADVFVLPSKFESFGVVLIEAMACGLPIVATRCGGAQSIITEKSYGELSEINDTDLAEKIDLVLNTKYDSKLIRESVLNRFSADAFAKEMTIMYSKLQVIP